MIVGVLLGPTLLDFLHWGVFHGIELGETIHEMAELGVIILMFNIGLEVSLKELGKVGRVGIFAGVLGAVAPILMVLPVMFAAGYQWEAAVFTGVTLAATSVSISAQVLFELGVLQTKEGNALLATALIDDVLAILLVSVVVAVTAASGAGAVAEEGGAAADLALVILRMVAYIVIAGA